MSRIAFVAGSNGPMWTTQLQYASQDESRVAECLSSDCGFTVYQPKKSNAADAFDIIRQVNELAATCKPKDYFVIYFSGHGELLKGNLFLLLDNTTEAIYDSAISSKALIDTLTFCQASHKLLILDCCHAGAAAGFKSIKSLEPILNDGGSQTILCASSRLELARELRKYGGSFLAHGIISLISNDDRVTVSLTDLIEGLVSLAREHNISTPTEFVPTPYLFGERPNGFFLKQNTKDSSVQVQFSSLFKTDMDLFQSSLSKYLEWNKVYILEHMPVKIGLIPQLVERSDVLRKYIETDIWPNEISQRGKDQARHVANDLFPQFQNSLINVIRVAVTLTIRSNGVTMDFLRNILLEVYISGKALAISRVFMSFWLVKEPESEWRLPFRKLAQIWSESLITGLTYIAANYYKNQWAYWVDADCCVGETRVKVFIPQTVGEGVHVFDTLKQEDYFRLILPQLFQRFESSEEFDTTYYNELGSFIELPYEKVIATISIRGENFIDTISHNSPGNDPEAKNRSIRIAAKKIAANMKSIKPSERQKAFRKLVPSSYLYFELQRIVTELLENIDKRSYD